MAPLVASTPDLQWSSCEDCCETRKWNQSEDDNIDMDNSRDFDDYSKSLASSSSFLFSSISGSTGSISTGSYASDVSRPNNAEQMFGNCTRKENPAIRQGPIPMPSYRCGAMDGFIDPRLMTSDSILAHDYRALRKGSRAGMKQVSCGDKTARRRCNNPPKLAPLDARHHIRNDFDIAFDEMQVVMPSPNRGVRMWLHTWVATNPDRLPDKRELESLKTLSALSESEIMAWLSQYVSTRLNPMAEPTDGGREEIPRLIYAPRYRPKCRRSRRRVRYIAEAPGGTKIYECTHGCGQHFTKKGQWTRHERYNLEEWRCHLCKFISARKDKLLKHLREGHSLRGFTKKSHCRQLLQPSARLCGFCLKQFDNWSAWLNHVGAHFEGHIADGPWTMARWNKAVDQGFSSNESDDNDDDDDDDYNNGNDEDQTDHDFDSSAADQAGDPSSKNKGGCYESGSQGSSRSSRSSKSASSGNGGSKSPQGASGRSPHQERDLCTQFGAVGKIDTLSHTVSLLESSSPGDLPLDGGEVQELLPSKNLDLSVHHSQQRYPSQESSWSHGSRLCEVLQNVEWNKHRETITRLYKLENKSLREVQQIMDNEHGFRASLKMYKEQIINWGLQKRPIFRDTMSAYSRVREHFRQQRVSRWLDRHPKTPSIISCVQPAPPLLAPSDSISRLDLVSRRPSTGHFCIDTKIHEPGVSEAFYMWRCLDSVSDTNFVRQSSVDELNSLYLHLELSMGNVLNLDLADDERLAWYGSSPQGTLGCRDIREMLMAGADSSQVNHMNGRGLLWIGGSAGSGKSILTKHVLKDYGIDTTTKDPLGLFLLLDRALFFHLGMLDASGRGVGATWLKRRTVELQPRTASFDTIRKLFSVTDPAHLERFKVERFLNDPDGGSNLEHFLADGMESCAPDPGNFPEMFFGIDVLLKGHSGIRHQVNVGEIALQKEIKVNAIETRFCAIKKRHNLNISTTTIGFTKQKPSTPKRLATTSSLKAIECLEEGLTRPRRTSKPSNKKCPADKYALNDVCLFEDRASMSSKWHMSDLDESKDDVSACHAATGDYHGNDYDLNGEQTVKDFHRESTMLDELSGLPHDHVAPHLASWTPDGKFYMLSPLADCNLKTYLSENETPLLTKDFVTWLLNQMRGLADGVSHLYHLGAIITQSTQLHNAAHLKRACFHHDLKPQNILVFGQKHTSYPFLKISDFGLGRLRSGMKGSYATKNPTHGTPEYEGPDWMQDHKPSGNEDVSRCAAITPHGFHGEHELHRHPNRHHGVAERFKKPLFQITCGDLGADAKQVETALQTNFAPANSDVNGLDENGYPTISNPFTST